VENSVDDFNEMLVNVETAIKGLNYEQKNSVRAQVKKVGEEIKRKVKGHASNKFSETLKSLNNKDVFYLKADKGNTVVIMNKSDYFERMDKLIVEGPYVPVKKDPINKFIKAANTALKNCPNLINNGLCYKLKVSNPILPRIYGLPKIHKEGKKMRPIVSGINAPTYLISKWLIKEFTKFKKPDSKSVKNTYEFIKSMENGTIGQEEKMVSFDVVSLFPSIPLEQAFKCLQDWLVDCKVEERFRNEYILLTKLCMAQSTFRFNGKFYSQINGTTMGNPLSGFLAELFMGHFETVASKEITDFPRVWIRYVDDIFAIVDKQEGVNKLLNDLNGRENTIKFTVEEEIENSLPFLDTRILKREDGSLEFEVFRKLTNTNRFITADSHHSKQHKRSALNSLVSRLNNFSLNKENFKKELNIIKAIAVFNGFEKNTVDEIQTKFMKRKERKERTTLTNAEEENNWRKVTFCPPMSNKIANILKKEGIRVTQVTRLNLKRLLSNPKDKIEKIDRAGIYELKCECGKEYVGQTKRKISVRIKEHEAHFKYSRDGKSAMADHAREERHDYSKMEVKVLKVVEKNNDLDAWETLFINKFKNNLVNFDDGPIGQSLLIKGIIK
jgi:hypothetical protein